MQVDRGQVRDIPEIDLELRRIEITSRKLILKSPHGSRHESLHALDLILVACRIMQKDRIVDLSGIYDAFLSKTVALRVVNGGP